MGSYIMMSPFHFLLLVLPDKIKQTRAEDQSTAAPSSNKSTLMDGLMAGQTGAALFTSALCWGMLPPAQQI